MREITFCVMLAVQFFLIVFGKWGRIHGERIDLPLRFHIPYQIIFTAILLAILNPWKILAE